MADIIDLYKLTDEKDKPIIYFVCIQKEFKTMNEKKKRIGPDRGSNPEPLAPKARIIPLDHQATVSLFLFLH